MKNKIKEKIYTHGGEDIRYKLCRCSECKRESYCSPSNDFYVRADSDVNGPLVCESCLTRGLTVINLGVNPNN